VVDKDRASALLAARLGAQAFLLLTDVDAVYDGFGTPGARRLDTLTQAEAATLDLPAGSMGPKVEAATQYLRQGGGLAAIGRLEDAVKLLDGRAGTRIVA